MVTAVVTVVLAAAACVFYEIRPNDGEAMKAARAQCTDAFLNAATRISEKYRVSIVVGPVHVERRIGRDEGADTLDCSANVGVGSNSQSDRWMAEWRPGEAVTLLSVTLLGAEMVGEVVKGIR